MEETEGNERGFKEVLRKHSGTKFKSTKNEVANSQFEDPLFKQDSLKRLELSSEKSSSEDASSYIHWKSWEKLSEFLGEERLWLEGDQGLEGEFEKPCFSETEETPSSETKEKSDESTATSSEALSNVYSKLSPFKILWSFGINFNVELINLTTTDVSEVFFVSSHFGIIYDYNANIMTFLPGHNYPITCISADASGRWLVTADAGEDTVIIIWDKKKILPVWALYNVFPGEGVMCVKISQDARFLAAINCNFNHSLKFWEWTYGREEPDGVIDINPAYGKAEHIDFNHINTEQFIITCRLKVILCEWNKKTKELKSFSPDFELRQKKIGTLRESLFLDDRHTVTTSTSQGYVVVWCDVKYTDPIVEEVPGTIEKHFLKVVRLQKSGITSIRLCDKIIATSSEDGVILFHDQYFRLMYYLPNLKIDPVRSISFNIDYISCTSDPFAVDLEKSNMMENEFDEGSEYELYMVKPDFLILEMELNNELNKALQKETNNCEFTHHPDCTLNMRNFEIRDFIFLTTSGKMGYLSHKRKKVKYFLYQAESPVLAMDCNPNKPHLVVGHSHGRLILYDYNHKKSLLSKMFSNPVTMLKYSNLGHSLMAGFQNGELLELDALLLTVRVKLEISKNSIVKLCFSQTDDLFAFYDQSSTVQVYKKKQATNQWVSMGRYISHYKPIVDIMFEERQENPKFSRLFSIGQDRMLVEYDMKNLEENKLNILSFIRLEQTAIPCCFSWLYDTYKTPHFLVSNDQYKLKVINAENYVCQKTTLGPTADTPINFMTIIKDPDKNSSNLKMIYTTEKHIGIRILPPTGNPFEGMGMVAHPEKLVALAKSHDDKYIFTVGVNDPNPFMWEVNLTSVEVACHLGGVGLEPFVSLVEGGANSFLLREVDDFFYYAQIIHQGEDPNTDRSVSKNLALCEIPDLFRALGYFPTDYEVDNLLHELKYMDYEKNETIRTEITYEECVKAFLNHRPVSGISLSDINKALLAIADVSDPTDIRIEKSDFYRALEETAEAMEHAEVVGYMCILLLPKDESNPLPENMGINDFAEQVFGIDLTITEENVREITHAFENKS